MEGTKIYKRKKYAQVSLLVTKGGKEKISERAKELDISMTKLITRALETQYHLGLMEEEPINQPR